MPGGAGTDFEAHCMAVTVALRERGSVWPALEAALGDEAGREIEPVINGDPVWVVDQARMSPRPRRSLVDYADIVTINATDTSSESHVRLGEPIGSPANAGYGPTSPTCSRVRLETKRQMALWHNVGWDAIDASRGNIVHDILMSFYSRIALNVESSLLSAIVEGGSRTAASRARGSPGNGRSGHAVSAGGILDAARNVTRSSPGMAFPGDLVCMVSPAQAIRLAGEGALGTRGMSIHGIDVVVSAAAGDGGRVAMVSARRALRVALSKVEVRFMQRDEGCSVWVEYGMGCAVDPQEAAVALPGVDAAPRRQVARAATAGARRPPQRRISS